jgi:hypothetical protein
VAIGPATPSAAILDCLTTLSTALHELGLYRAHERRRAIAQEMLQGLLSQLLEMNLTSDNQLQRKQISWDLIFLRHLVASIDGSSVKLSGPLYSQVSELKDEVWYITASHI